MASIFKIHEYQTFGLMKMHNMSKIRFANDKFNLLRWNKNHHLWFFKVFQLTEIVSDLRLRLWLCWLLKKDLCNLAKTFNILLDKIARVWNFQLLLNSKSLKLSLHSLLKNMSKTSMGVLKKETIFFKFCLCSKCRYFSITRFDILIFCNILHLEMNFGNLH